jgi:uncharacterized cupredoxin-like copper-binding protein
VTTPRPRERSSPLLVLLLVAGLALAACTADTRDQQDGTGSGMMDGTSGYSPSDTTCSAPDSLPGRTVRVLLVDMGMTKMMGGDAPMGARMKLILPVTEVAAGTITFLASNRGWRTHELVVLPLDAGAQAGDRSIGSGGRVSEAGSLGEASASCAADTGEGIESGSTGWTTLTLPRGRYELICNLRNHYAYGMRSTLVVS